MLKYGNIIGRLSATQKVTLLTDISCLKNKEFKNLGIPELNIGDVERYMSGVFPAPAALANSFDRALISAVAADVAFAAAVEGTDMLLTPAAKAKTEPYRIMLSEDPMLSSELAGLYLGAAHQSGVSPCVSEACLRDSETAWLDDKPDPRIIYDFAVKPTASAVGRFGATALMSSGFFDDPEYRNENLGILDNVATGRMFGVSYAVVKQATDENTVDYIKRGYICLRGDALAVENAMKQYEVLKKHIDKGDSTVFELEDAEREGKAISPEMLDAAADRVIDFLMNARRKYAVQNTYHESRDFLSFRAVKESAVLLKNDEKLLPLKKKAKICVIGDIAMRQTAFGTTDVERLEALMTEKGYSFTGYARGYDFSCDRSDRLIGEAVNLAQESDRVLLFLGTDEARENDASKLKCLELPANQVALATKLASLGKKIIAIVSSAMSFDVSAIEKFGAVLVLKLGTKYSADAAADILSGAYNPSGRLANTLYRNTTESFKKQRQYRLSGSVKAGPFVGYRYYDTAGIDVGFPFGHGMSYTTFAYSRQRVSGGKVSVVVKNTGKLEGSETVQFYIGKTDSAVLRPKKELMAFEKISLKPGESRTVEAEIRFPEIYDGEKRQIVVESGEYTIYIGSSVENADHTVRCRGGNGSLPKSDEPLYKYLQSESNIIAEKYTLEANYISMKKSLKNILSGLALLILAAGLQMYCHIAGVDGNFLNIFSLALVVVAAVFFVAELLDRQKEKNRIEAEAESANKKYFKDAETIQVFSTDRMFDTEFDETPTYENTQNVFVTEDLSAEYLKYVDKSFDFAIAAKEFENFAIERGYIFSADTVRGIFASLASSRIMIIDGLNDVDFKSLMYLLCEYFESALYIDAVDAGYVNEDSLLFFRDAEGRVFKRTALLALESAVGKKHTMHLSAMTNVKFEDLPKYIIPFAKYAKNPSSNNSISIIQAAGGRQSYYIPPNMWFVLHLAPGQTADNVPEFISEIATVTNISFGKTERKETFSTVHKFYYYQMDYLSERVTAKYELAEEDWKKIDAFADFVRKHAEYTIGNKQWLCLEKYISTFLASGGEADMAIDHGFAVKVLPSVLTALEGCEGRDDIDLLDAINVIFGEENMDTSREVIKNFAKNKTANAEQGAV